ncbi:MBG domain-containing protein [Azospirillum brasilense]|uniref:MBG domain-containing protein n=1 Tax=Azospirillum brasilense TaxID=192 RepID=UPI0015865E62|nr:MBG domain-containing protein [Azospirillum brasilense]
MTAIRVRLTTRTGRPRHGALLAALLATTALSGVPRAMAQDLPSGGRVAAGSATIGTAANGAMTVTQSSPSAVVNWQSFSVGQGNSVNFIQPSGNTAILNRVTGATPSTIAGAINANGQVYLVNPNGITITKTGTVNAAGFVASTLAIGDDDFMAGKRDFAGNGASATVSNAGTITIGRGGYAALLGGAVDNAGTITVPLGKVGLGSGERATLDLSGDGFLQVAVPTKAEGKGALVRNSGKIAADGGSVQLSAAAAKDMARQTINLSGTVEARTVGGRSGDILLAGGDGEVEISGTAAATALDVGGGTGGTVTATGRTVALKGAVLDTSGKHGGGTVRVGGGREGKGTLPRADTVTVDSKSRIKADAAVAGKGGDVVVWSDRSTRFDGTISARGGALSGDGGQAEVSGKATLAYTGFTDLSAARGAFGTLLLDPYNVTISNGGDVNHTGFTATGNDSVINATTLLTALSGANVTVSTGAGGSQDGDITVAAPLSWSAATTLTLSAHRSIAINADIDITGGGGLSLITNNGGSNGTLTFGNGASASFAAGQSGQSLTINGQGYTLLRSMADIDSIDSTGLGGRYALTQSLDASGTTYTDALVGINFANGFTGTFEGLGHTVSGLTINKSGNYAGLIGRVGMNGVVRNIGVVGGSVSGAMLVGGLVGSNAGTIANAYATGTVNGTERVGGLAGQSEGMVTNAYATGAASGSRSVGGLVGYNTGQITNAYATGAVTASSYSAGGLVGTNGGSIGNAYATGATNSPLYAGGVVGEGSSGNLSNLYWDTQTTGRSAGVGIGPSAGTNARTRATLQTAAAATSLGAAFGGGAGLYPYLTSLSPGGVQAMSGTVYKDAGTTVAASGSGGAVTVTGFAKGSAFGTATTGADGSYYIAGRAGSFGGGDSLLVTTAANATTGSTDAATLATATGTGLQSGINVYGKTLTLSTAATTLSGAPTPAVARSSAIAAAGNDAAAAAVIDAIAGRGFLATGAGFTIDQAVDTAGGFLVRTATGAPLTVSSPVTIQSGGNLGLLSGGALAINAPVTVQGAGAGAVALAYDTGSVTNLSFGNGAGLTYTDAAGAAITSSAGGTLTVNGNAYTLLYSMADIDGIDSAGLSGRYALARSLDASGTTYTAAPVTGVFTGVFEGLGHSIAGLTVSAPSSCAGLFCNIDTSGAVRDIGLVGGSVNGGTFVGILAGSSDGTIANATATGTVSGSQAVGGLVGYHYANGTITSAHATGAVSGTTAIGGLVGANYGTITKAYATGAVTGTTNVGGLAGANTGTITTAYATGTANGNQAVGGLVGFNTGTITNAHAGGAVSGGTRVGGLVGDNRPGSGITAAYATGAVTGTTDVGGLVGSNAGTITGGLWNTATSGRSAAFGTNSSGQSATGLTTAQFQDGTAAAGLGGGFTLSSGLYPYLTSLFPDGVQAVSGTAPTGGTVHLRADTGTVAIVSVGADGSYYVALPSGSIATGGSSLLAWSTGAATNGATFRTGVTTGRVTDFDITGGMFREFTALTTLSALDTAYAASSGGSGITGTFANRAITASGAFTIDDALTATGTVSVGTAGNLTIGATGTVSGTAVTLSATGAFVNNRGSDAVTATSDRWLIYSANSVGNTFGGLDSGNTAVWNTSAGATVGAAGNRYVFAEQPLVTVTTVNAGKTYGDDGTTSAGASYTITGLSPGVTGAYLADTAAAVLSGAPSVSSSGSAATAGAGDYGYTLGLGTLAASGGYAISLSNTGLFTVTPRSLTVTADAQSRTYGDANLTLTYAITSGSLANGDTLSGSLATAATGASGVGTYAITQGSLAASPNYALTYTGANLTVTPRSLTVTADAQSRSYGDANPALTYAITSGSLVNGDALSGNLATTATGASGVGAYAITQGSLAASSNYTLTYSGANLTVTPRGLAVTAGAQSRSYGDANPALSYSVGGGGLVNGDALSGSLATTATGTSGVGAYAITQGSLAASPNYAITYSGANLTVTPRSLAVTADAQSRAYGDANPALTYAITSGSLVNGDTLSGSLATAATGASGVGAYAITQGSLAASSNYTLTYSGANLTVTPRGLAVTAGAQSRSYGDANPALSYSVGGGGLVNGDALSGNLATAATNASGVGTYAITQGSLAASPNYSLTYSGANLTVTPRSLAVTADAQSRSYGDANPALTYSVGGGGLVNGDTLSGSLATTATGTSNVGAYAITQGSLAASPNYALTYTGANLTVTPRGLAVTADAQSRSYGDANPALSYSISGGSLVNGDALSGNLATAATNASGVGTYAITQGSLAASPNYSLTYSGANLTVTPRSLAVTADAQSRSYGDANPALTYSVGGGGLVNGDTLSGSLATTATGTSNVGAYAITQGSLAASPNYALTYTGANLTVTPRGLAVTADAQSRSYGDANLTLTYAITSGSLVNGDALSGSLATTATGTSNVGTYAITQGSLAASPNYSLTYSGANLTVTPRSLAVTADAQSRSYGDANPALTYSVGGGGLVNGDTLSGNLATAATGASGVGTYAITQGLLAASPNYAITYTGANLTVTPRSLTVTADAQSRAYGDANLTLTYAITSGSLVNGDTLSGSLATAATNTSGVGAYAITQGSLAASPNYAIAFVPNLLTIVAAPSEARELTASTLAKNHSLVSTAMPWVVSLQPGIKNVGTATGVNLMAGRRFNSVLVCVSEASNCSAGP